MLQFKEPSNYMQVYPYCLIESCYAACSTSCQSSTMLANRDSSPFSASSLTIGTRSLISMFPLSHFVYS